MPGISRFVTSARGSAVFEHVVSQEMLRERIAHHMPTDGLAARRGAMSMVAVSTASRATSSRLRPELEQLFREHSHMLYRTAFGMLGNRADAEDVLQTVFLRLLRRELPPDLSKNPPGYLYRSAVNISLNVIRARTRLAPTVDVEAIDVAAQETGSGAADERHRRLMAAIAALEPKDAQILVLRYVHEQSDAAIAKLLGVSRGTIAMRLLRARLRLKKLIGDEP